MKTVYIAHPIGGDVENNIKRVLSIVSGINLSEMHIHPFAPYLVDLMTLNDNIPSHREKGMAHNEKMLRCGIIDEVWLYGDRISNGMLREIEIAEEMGIPVLAMSESTIKERFNKFL